MNITWVAASDRFDGTSVSNEIVDGRSLPPMVFYTCPRCSERVGFSRDNLMGAVRRTTALPEPVANSIAVEAQSRDLGELGFLDWPCPKCRLLVRAHVRTWAGGRHGDYGADIMWVAEIDHAF